MLEHMIEAQVLDLVLSGVNLVVRILKVRFDDEGRRVASFGCAGVIRACVAAFGQNIWDSAIFCDDLLDESEWRTKLVCL